MLNSEGIFCDTSLIESLVLQMTLKSASAPSSCCLKATNVDAPPLVLNLLVTIYLTVVINSTSSPSNNESK